jgi:hypothetical protein
MAVAVALESLDINRPAVCQECGRRCATHSAGRSSERNRQWPLTPRRARSKSSYALYSSDSDSDSGSVPGIIDSDSDSVPGVVDTDSEEEAGPPRAAGARVRPLASQVEPWTEAEDAFLRRCARERAEARARGGTLREATEPRALT